MSAIDSRSKTANMCGREFRSMNANIHALQEQIDNLYTSLGALRNAPESIGALQHGHGSYPRPLPLAQPASQPQYPSISSPQSREKQPRFQGPTSSAFGFDVANSSLQTMGITEANLPDEGIASYDGAQYSSPPEHRAAVASMTTLSPNDPFWKVEKAEVIRLCKVYEEEMGMMFPMLDIEKIMDNFEAIFAYAEPASSADPMNRTMPDADKFETDDVNILKLVLALTLIIEGSGESELGRELFETVRNAIETKLWEPIEVKGLIILVLAVSKV